MRGRVETADVGFKITHDRNTRVRFSAGDHDLTEFYSKIEKPFLQLDSLCPQLSSYQLEPSYACGERESILTLMDNEISDKRTTALLHASDRSAMWPVWKLDTKVGSLVNLIPADVFERISRVGYVSFTDMINQMEEEDTRFLAHLLMRVGKFPQKDMPLRFLDVISFYLCRPPFGAPSMQPLICTPVSRDGLLSLRRDGQIAILLNNRRFLLYSSTKNECIADFDFGSCIVNSARLLVTVLSKKSEGKTAEFRVKDPETLALWSDIATRKNCLLPSIRAMDNIYHPFYFTQILEAVVSDDMTFVRALLNSNIIAVSESQQLIKSLLSIFIYKKKIDRFLLFMSYWEIKGAKSEAEVLRGNTFTWKLTRVFQDLYCQEYITDIVRPISESIAPDAPLNIKTPEHCKVERVRELMISITQKLIKSKCKLPIQFCHFAYYLRNAAIATFNSPQGVLNTISAFYALRFVFALIIAPDQQEEMNPTLRASMTQFFQLLQTLFGLHLIDGRKYPHLAHLNKDLGPLIPQIADFLFSIADIDVTTVTYPKVTVDQMNESVRTVINTILPKLDSFRSNYEFVSRDPRQQSLANSWAIENTLLAGFTSMYM